WSSRSFGEMAVISRPVGSTGAAADEAEDSPDLATTSFGGLFYLLPLSLELGVAEQLWRACLPERIVLARAVAALIRSMERADDDPAPALFGGAPATDSLPELAAEQQEEVAGALLAAYLEAVPRRGLAEIPEVHARLVGAADDRLLTVSAREGGYVLYARPARSVREAQAGLEEFLTLWPGRPLVLCDPALGELDRGGRVRPL